MSMEASDLILNLQKEWSSDSGQRISLAMYLERRRQMASQAPSRRTICRQCLQPSFACYCAGLRPFDPGMTVVVLHHPIELKRRIATGRMTHLCLKGSHLFVGNDYSGDAGVNALLKDPSHYPVLLYPGRGSTNLSDLAPTERTSFLPTGRRLLLFVVDGTWNTARQMVRRSRNLATLPRICFTPPGPSNFRVRKQPAPGCYSTIEAVHHAIELMGDSLGFSTEGRRQDHLIEMFDRMVEQQLSFIQTPRLRRTEKRHEL